MLRTIARSVVDCVYPPFCPLCGERADGASACASCVDDWRPEREDWCERCGAPVGPHLDTTRGCVHCSKDRFQFDGVRAIGVYQGRVRTACRIGKEARGAALTSALAGMLLDLHRPWFEEIRAEVVVPVPRHWATRWWTEHDAADVLARGIARRLGLPVVDDVLAKVKRTPPQSKLTATERRKNLRDAFAVRANGFFTSQRVLLVDDVLTTGTTADRCARVLRADGATSIHVAVLARGVGANTDSV